MVSTKQMVELWRIMEQDVLNELNGECRELVAEEIRTKRNTSMEDISTLKLQTAERFREAMSKQFSDCAEVLSVALELISYKQIAKKSLAEGYRMGSKTWDKLSSAIGTITKHGMTDEELSLLNGQIMQDFYNYREAWLMFVVLTNLGHEVVAMMHEESEKNQ